MPTKVKYFFDDNLMDYTLNISNVGISFEF